MNDKEQLHRSYLNNLPTAEVEAVQQAAAWTLMRRRNGGAEPSDAKAAQSVEQAYSSVADRDLAGLAYDRETGHHEITLDNFERVMTYQPWMPHQVDAGKIVHEALVAAGKAILRSVQRCPSRDVALQHLIDARMRANAAITHGRW